MIDVAQTTIALTLAPIEDVSPTAPLPGPWSMAGAMLSEPPIRWWKVEQLRAAIASGTYRVSAAKLAEAMLSSEARRRLNVLPDDGQIHEA